MKFRKQNMSLTIPDFGKKKKKRLAKSLFCIYNTNVGFSQAGLAQLVERRIRNA